MDQPPHDDGGAAFTFDHGMTTQGESGPIQTDVHAHQGISFADLVAALWCTQEHPTTEPFTTLVQRGYDMADRLIAVKRQREKAVSEYWRAQSAEVLAMQEQAEKERADKLSKPSDG